jgi:hexosaminidase
VFELLGDVLDEIAEIFPGPWIHAGGDEAPKERWLSCHRCRERMKAEGLRDEGGAFDPELLQGWFMDRVAKMLAERGKRMAGWDEILDGRVRRDALIMSWRGRAGGIAAARAGYDAIMCPQDHACYLDHKHLDSIEEPGNIGFCTVRESYAFDPIPPELTEEQGKRIIGGQANIWSEMLYSSRHVEYMAFPRLAALSEVFWTPLEKKDFAYFESRLGVHKMRFSLLGVLFYPGPLG